MNALPVLLSASLMSKSPLMTSMESPGSAVSGDGKRVRRLQEKLNHVGKRSPSRGEVKKETSVLCDIDENKKRAVPHNGSSTMKESEEGLTQNDPQPPAKRPRRAVTQGKPVTLREFSKWLDAAVAEEFGDWGSLERSKQITDGNIILKSAHVQRPEAWMLTGKSQCTAQYGRARYAFVSQAMKAVKAKPGDSVVDIGSGIGTVAFQVAATLGCRNVVGVELCSGRHMTALRLKRHFDDFVIRSKTPACEVKLYQGDFREPKYFEMCTNADVIFVNNAESVFGSRSVVAGHYTLDWHVARAFCNMKVGSRIACFEALVDLDQNHIKGCFERAEHLSEKGATSWTETSGKRTRFFSYQKLRDTWICRHCSSENSLLRNSSNRWGQVFQDTCACCENKPGGFRKSYPTRRAFKV